MKFEKRAAAGETPDTAPETDSSSGSGKKPVIIYIMILFLAAFVLMFLSLLAHQRSNTEAIGKLQDSVSALQEVQAVQDQNLKLQEEIQKLQDQLAQAESDRAGAQDETAALLQLYTLQQQYANGDYDACRHTIQAMEDADQGSALPKSSDTEGVVSPAERYQQLKEAVMSK